MKATKWLALLLVLCLCLAGCNGKNTTSKTDTPADTQIVYDGQIDPAAVALVANSDQVQVAMTVQDMTGSISETGTTRIKLLNDIRQDKALSLPYSCSIDFDGHTIATNPDKGTGIMIVEAGTENPVSTLKNGKLVCNAVSLWVNSGAIVLDTMQIHSLAGTCVGLYDPEPAYKSINRITNCTLITGGKGCVAFSKTDLNFRNTGITIEASRLINTDPEGGYVFASQTENRACGVFHLGQNVELYGYAPTAVPETYLYFTGKLAHKTQRTDLTVDDTTWENIQQWSTESTQDPENLLFIGNSFCYYFVQELQGMADANGKAVNVTNLYEAGCRIDEHWTWLNDPEAGKDKYELWITNDMGRFLHGDITTSNDALAYMHWDKITVQQHFTPGKAKTYEAAMDSCTPFAKNMFDHLKENHSDAQLYWHEHWAFQIGHDTVPDLETQTRQYENLRAACITISEENGVTMIPGGDAWQLARADSMFGDNLCKSDNIHDGETQGGQYLNACVWYETLFRESCLGNTWRPDYNLSEKKITALQQYAHQAVAEFHGADYAK